MKKFSISFNAKEEAYSSREKSNPNNLSNYIIDPKNLNLENQTTKNSPLLKPIKKNNSFFTNYQYTKSFPLEDHDLSELDMFLDENHILFDNHADKSNDAYIKNKPNNKNKEETQADLVLKIEEYKGLPSDNT
jgi:hypothetical protein